MWCFAVTLAILAVPAVALGQDEESSSGDEGSAEGEGGEQPDWDLPRVLIVAEKYVPDQLENNVRRVLKNVGEQVSTSEYVRKARSEGYPPTSFKAFKEVLPGLDVDLVVVVAGAKRYGRRHLKLIYREGKGGLVLLEEIHPLAGLKLTESVKQRVLSESRLALSVVTRPEGEKARPPGKGPPENVQQERGSAVHVGLTALGGVGSRAFELPSETGPVQLDTKPFAVAGLRLGIDVEPTAKGRFSYGAQLQYLTSVALTTTEQADDGTEVKTGSRSQALDLALEGRWRVAESQGAVTLGLDIGYGFRLFRSEKPIRLPEFGLSGPLMRISIEIPLLQENQLVLGLAPEVQYYVNVGDPLPQYGVKDQAIGVGGQAELTLELTEALFLGALYREQHALLQVKNGNANDASRFIVARFLYRP